MLKGDGQGLCSRVTAEGCVVKGGDGLGGAVATTWKGMVT